MNMKMIQKALAALFLVITAVSFAQTELKTDDGYQYETVANDPLQARIYTLGNGLKVYLSVNKSEPRIYTYIAVRTGRKNDPPYAQGLSHYLEHMLFKGTDKFGTLNFDLEKPLIDSITAIYNVRKNTTDKQEREMLYRKIDSLSYIASSYAIPNEYDRMIAEIGGSGTNAYTSFEETVYMNDIPSNQLYKWLNIEAERFRNPVMRLFHTELEAVYEEKNMSLDDDGDKVFDALWAGLFKRHTYGTQTTLGSVEQLQNPSISEIQDYYYSRYVPGNMAIMLAGDFDPSEAIKLIDKTFGQFPSKDFSEFNPPVEDPISTPETITVLGPSEESVTFAYRADGASSKDANLLTLIEYILSNGKAGLIDLNLNQSQKVIDAYCYSIVLKDYSTITFGGKPRQGQSLEDVKELLMSQIELVKKGEFPDWLIPAVAKNFKVSQIRSFDRNSNRVGAFVNSFVLGVPWENYIFNIDTLATISKQEVVEFANQNFKDNYVVVYKKTGSDPGVVKVEKPPITPVKVNRDEESEFSSRILKMNSEEIHPEFVDLKKEIRELRTASGIPVYYLRNEENELFNLSFIIDFGTQNDRMLSLASQYLGYTGAGDLSADKLREEFYKLAVNTGNSVELERTSASLSGLDDSFESSLKLFEESYGKPTGNEESLEKLVDDVLKNREDDKLSKETILWSAMYSYAKYGKFNPFTNRLSSKELREIGFEQLLNLIRELFTYRQKIYYYGPKSESELLELLNTYHKTSAVLRVPEKEVKYEEIDQKDREVYVVNYDMQQAEIVMLAKAGKYDYSRVPTVTLFNEYFGGGMSSVVFQDIRESKALAYSASASYSLAKRSGLNDYVFAYVGTQADKLPEAMKEMKSLLNDMPLSEATFKNSRNSILNKIASDRVKRQEMLGAFETASRFGIDFDMRQRIYESVPEMGLNDIKKFHEQNFANKNYTVLVLGDVNKLDMNVLKKYGEVKTLDLKDVFGY